jgi:putative spermidine/putrescine transport system ATP-binding protein
MQLTSVMSAPQQVSATPQAVHLANVTKSYGSFKAVRGIDLAIQPGDFVTLLGPSGSGKTTTLMMIAGFETPTSGRVFINGADSTNVPTYRRNLSMVFQNYALFPHRTVAGNVAFPLQMRRLPSSEIEHAVEEALAMVRLTGLEKRLPAQLSGGQQQRVALARAIGFSPSILLMDEPLGALDKNLREQVQWEIKDIQRRLGVTVVYVTHDQHEALTMSDRIVVMNNGMIEQDDPPEAIYHRPRNRFVAGFLGASNFITAEVRDIKSRDFVTAAIDGSMVLTADDPGNLRVGEAVTLTIRPERLEIFPYDAAPSSVETCTARVVEATFMGDSIAYAVAVGPQRLNIKVPNSGRAFCPSAGEEVAIGWMRQDVTVLAD